MRAWNRRDTLLASVAALGWGTRVQAQGWPSRPIRLVVPFTPGGSSDLLGRAIGQKLSESLGQPVLIDNVPGAGGSLGADRVAKAAPDGHTLLMGHIGTHAVNPLILPNLPYDPVKHFAPVAWVANVPNVLAVHPSVPARSLQELVALARARPGQLNYGTGGNGSAAHLATEYLKLKPRTFIVHVPYRGAAPAITDLVAGQTQLIFTGAPALAPFVKSGQLRALAVSSAQRLDVLPDAMLVTPSPDTSTLVRMPSGCATPVPLMKQLSSPTANASPMRPAI